MARMHGGRRPNEKAKDFKGTMKKLIRYMAIYKVQVSVSYTHLTLPTT